MLRYFGNRKSSLACVTSGTRNLESASVRCLDGVSQLSTTESGSSLKSVSQVPVFGDPLAVVVVTFSVSSAHTRFMKKANLFMRNGDPDQAAQWKAVVKKHQRGFCTSVLSRECRTLLIVGFSHGSGCQRCKKRYRRRGTDSRRSARELQRLVQNFNGTATGYR